MMFRTEIAASVAPFALSHANTVLTIGSCFASNMAERLQYHGFNVLCNPFGTVYSPLAIAQQLLYLKPDAPLFEDNDVFAHNGTHHSFLHHSRFDRVDKTAFLEGINTQLLAARAFMAEVDTLIITLGTAQTHFIDLARGRMPTANCHRLPASRFQTERVGAADCFRAINEALLALNVGERGVRVVFSVSPVRYLREGLVGSARSKAQLLLATDELVAAAPDRHYFAAYEYLLDDLRDYRFFADDMLHPNRLALDYIWSKLAATYFDAATVQACEVVASVQKLRAHRTLYPDTPQAIAFAERAAEAWRAVCEKYPGIRPAELEADKGH